MKLTISSDFQPNDDKLEYDYLVFINQPLRGLVISLIEHFEVNVPKV